MSRSNNTDLVNPAVRYFDWAGKASVGKLTYYDKESKETIAVRMPFRFLVLDRVAQVGGGTGKKKDFQGFWSNAVRDTRVDPFIVKNKNGVYAEGLWKDIKDKHTAFVTGLYIAFYDENKELQIGYLRLQGCANSAWIEFTKTHRNIYRGVFSITGAELDDSGEVSFKFPVYDWSDKITDETNDAATALDSDILQPYLTAYFAQQGMTAKALDYSGGDGEGDYDARQERAAIESEKAFNPRRYDPNDDPANPLNQGPDETQDVPEGIDDTDFAF